MAKKIYLSPANHANQNVCRYNNKKCRETIHCRGIAAEAKRYLTHNGFSVKVRSTTSASSTMDKAVAAANSWGADIYVPIHTNASSDTTVSGVMFMTLNKTAAKYKTAYEKIGKTIQKEYAAALKAAGYTAKGASWVARPDLYEITEPKALTFYLELGFHTNLKPDVTHFIHADNFKIAGKAVAKGICAYYGVTFQDPDKVVAPVPEKPAEPEKPVAPAPQPEPAPTPKPEPGEGGTLGAAGGMMVLGLVAAVIALLYAFI